PAGYVRSPGGDRGDRGWRRPPTRHRVPRDGCADLRADPLRPNRHRDRVGLSSFPHPLSVPEAADEPRTEPLPRLRPPVARVCLSSPSYGYGSGNALSSSPLRLILDRSFRSIGSPPPAA